MDSEVSGPLQGRERKVEPVRSGAGGELRFRFRPRSPHWAGLAVVLGLGMVVASLLSGAGPFVWLGGAAAALGALYFASPVWRHEVFFDERAVWVMKGDVEKMRLLFAEVEQLTYAPSRATAFLDGGAPDKSLLLPGRGARAGYRIENQAALLDALRAKVALDRQVEVERLGRGANEPSQRPPPPP